jgi:DNA-binding GntR family transcriptional regulator
MESIMAVFSDFKSRSITVNPEHSKNIIKGHEAIVDAIAVKKKKLAIKLLRKDLANAGRILLDS